MTKRICLAKALKLQTTRSRHPAPHKPLPGSPMLRTLSSLPLLRLLPDSRI
nr:MAG TPA: hypothetical protein [Caudoviricetes sp.]